MSTRDINDIDRGPVRLVKTPTNLGTTFPYGGTELGATRGNRFRAIQPIPLVMLEEFGCPGEGIEGGEWCIFTSIMRQIQDPTLTATLHRNTAAGAGTPRVVNAKAAGTVRAGHLASDRSFKLLIVPENTTDHEAILIFKALPIIVEGSEILYSILGESAYEASFVSIPDSTGRTYSRGKLSDLTL